MKNTQAHEHLLRNVGRALETTYIAAMGRDSLVQHLNAGAVQHILIDIPRPPEELIQILSRLTSGVVGAACTEREEWGIIHLDQLPSDWEGRINRALVASFIIQVGAAHEWHIREVAEASISDYLESNHPSLAPRLKEFRASRNCILHADGVADEQYHQRAGAEARTPEPGVPLPLDWSYAFDRTLNVLALAES